jgi:GTPase SAR1 family protein
MIGQSAAGKTSLINRFVEGVYEDDGLTTIGMDLKSVTLKMDDIVVRL